MSIFDFSGPQFIQLYTIVFVAAACSALVLLRILKNVRGDFGEVDMNPYYAAYLGGGEKRVVDAAAANLLHSAVLIHEANRTKASGKLPANAHPVEAAVFQAAKNHNLSGFGDFYPYVLPVSQYFRSTLIRNGLIVNDHTTAVIRVVNAMIMILPIIFLGMPKLLIGMSRHKPIFYLAFLCLLSAGAAYLFFRQKCIRTVRGDQAMNYLREQYKSLQYSLRHGAQASGSDVALALGIFGIGFLLTTPALAYLRPICASPNPSSGSWGGGSCSGISCGTGASGCGGGCGGGGCGGCGG